MFYHPLLLLLPLATSQGVSVYPPVPGLPPSPYYSLRVREVGEEGWLEAATLLTECTADKFCNTTGFYDHLNGWSNTYTNMVMHFCAKTMGSKMRIPYNPRLCPKATAHSPRPIDRA